MIGPCRLDHFVTLLYCQIECGTYELAHAARKEWVHFLKDLRPSKRELPRAS